MRINFTFLFSLVSFATAKDANWPSQEIYSGSHVNSASAHDYTGDGKKEILFSAEGKFFMYFAPKYDCLLYTSPSPRDGLLSRMPSSA